MKHKIYIISIFIFIIAIIIGIYIMYNSDNKLNADVNKIKVITTLFPQYDFVRQIGKDKVDVTLLLPPGVESHNYEPTPSDIIKINSSDMFIYTGDKMEPWASTIIQSLNNVNVINASNNIKLLENQSTSDANEKYDPHVWLDLDNAKIMVDNITDGLCKVDPQNAEFYKANADNYKNELSKLDNDIQTVVDNAKRKELVFGDKFALIYFMKKYNLNYITAYDSDSTETEPSVATITSIIQKINEDKLPVVFYAELSSHTVADSIAAQTGAKTLLFSTAHNVSKDELNSGITFIDIMRQNLENLKIALN